MQSHSRVLRVVAWIVITTFGTTNVVAATTPIDLATSPLVTGIGKTASPNVLFILDDSASMPLEYMPDNIPGTTNALTTKQTNACFKNFGFNTIYYNPNTTYDPPLQADGVTKYPDASFNGAWDDGYNTSTGSPKTDLSPTQNMGTLTAGPIGPTLIGGSSPITTPNSSGTKSVSITVAVSNLTISGHTLAMNDQVMLSGVTGSGSPATVKGVPISIINGQYYSITSVNTATKTFKITVTSSSNITSTSGSGGGSNVSLTFKYTYTGVVSTTPNYYYYTYTAGVAPYSATSPPSTCSSDGSYAKKDPTVDIGGTRTNVAQEKTNFANWYSYYRTRLLMMKTASGRSFSTLTSAYRVGFTVTSDAGMASGKFLGVKKFVDNAGSTQRTDWYNALYGINDSDTFAGTPLRGALSKAGRYFAGTLTGALKGSANDPVQYSCQQNFAILATDGAWNNYGEKPGNSSPSVNYGPFKENNTDLVNDQDSGPDADGNTAVTPYRDGKTGTTIIARQNTLADVAMYYYKTDLRPTTGITASDNGGLTDESSHIDVTTDNVATSNTDPAKHQHMTTFTLGLGVSDQLAYPSDYANILSGSKNWPDPNVSTAGVTVAGRVDDLWHAGVNGHGQYLSAKDPTTVEAALGQALLSITAETGSSSAAATSNLQPIAGDNTAFIAQFKTEAWTGDLVAREIDVVTGEIPKVNTWSAQALLDTQTTRYIYTYNTSGTTHLRDFTVANLGTEISAYYFNSDSNNPGGALTQWSVLSGTQQSNATAAAMIDYLRGVRTNENAGTWTTPSGLFRKREHVLGDIVSAAPVFVRKPPFAYLDVGYNDGSTSFLATQSSRAATVYTGANDGMLHAFNASTTDTNKGRERWAYVPKMVLKNLYKLAASDYSINHRFYVDGPITVGDAYNKDATTPYWATILVGGLGGGGKGYYALDVTDPANPKALWEFGTTPDYTGDKSYDANMGFSYGNPVITKLDDGDGNPANDRWVVLFASGYNNSTGDKKGHLFVVDAFTGEKLTSIGDIATTTTADEQLSGIARISNLVEGNGLRNNLTRYVYAGDLNGSLWRFDIQTGTAQHLADTSATAGAQPITVQPELATVSAGGNTYTVVLFGTGRYLGPNDLSTTAPSTSVAQAIYAVKDTGGNLGVLTLSGAKLVSQALSTTATPTAVDWSDKNGWYVTTPVGQRFNVDPGLQLGTLVIPANIPEVNYCVPNGTSVLYQLAFQNGQLLATNTFGAQIVGNTQLQLGGSGGSGSVQGGKIVIESVLANGDTMNTDQKHGGGAAGSVRRISWREIE